MKPDSGLHNAYITESETLFPVVAVTRHTPALKPQTQQHQWQH
jgi:hypothetical protein